MPALGFRGATVIGAGAWGTALAIQLARAGHAVCLWSRDGEHAAAMQSEHRNNRYLPDCRFPPPLEATADLEQAVRAGPALAMTGSR